LSRAALQVLGGFRVLIDSSLGQFGQTLINSLFLGQRRVEKADGVQTVGCLKKWGAATGYLALYISAANNRESSICAESGDSRLNLGPSFPWRLER
jgi:hypothetical protein